MIRVTRSIDILVRLLLKRKRAKDSNNFERSDAIRDELKQEGFVVKDAKSGIVTVYHELQAPFFYSLDGIKQLDNGQWIFWDQIFEYGFFFADTEEILKAKINEGYTTTYRGTTINGYFESKHHCLNSTYHQQSCISDFMPVYNTGKMKNINRYMFGSPNDHFFKDLRTNPDLSYYCNVCKTKFE
ncbi:MAG: hypothetical protein ABFD50_00920 [Smithella sp.]